MWGGGVWEAGVAPEESPWIGTVGIIWQPSNVFPETTSASGGNRRRLRIEWAVLESNQ